MIPTFLQTGVLCGLLVATTRADMPLFATDFHPICERGFGDRQNSIAWSMAWFKGHLYVGTSRSASCAQIAVFAAYFPSSTYPLNLPDIECPPTVAELRLQAEIWRLTPASGQWDLMYRCPADVEVPGAPGHYVARDIGYRDMRVYVEQDGTEALYVGGTCSRDFNRGVPGPRLLRSVDGVTFAPVPQDPGTFLASIDTYEGVLISGFNRLSEFGGKLVIGAGGAYGHAVLLASDRPELGNNHWQRVSPQNMTFTCMEPHLGRFYLSQGQRPDPGAPPFVVHRTDGQTLPYTLTQVVPAGGHRADASSTIVSFSSFRDQLWAGSNRPTELLRINPDDSWEVIMGQPRSTPTGYKQPLSGFSDGFDWAFNIHIHRMQTYEGWLYIGTNDFGNQPPFRDIPWWSAQLSPMRGFDLYRTRDGHYIYELTRSGFGPDGSDDFTARNFADTPDGLFVGTGNAHYGLRVFNAHPSPLPHVRPAERLEAEISGFGVLFHWTPSPDAVQYHLFMSNWDTKYADLRIATTTDTALYFPQRPFTPGRMYVIAEAPNQQYAPASNIVSSNPRTTPITFGRLNAALTTWSADPRLTAGVVAARDFVFQFNPAQAMAVLAQLKDPAAIGATPLPDWHARDFDIYIDKLVRRLYLVQRGILNPFFVL